MKAELAPKHTQEIGNNYVLWFESSNSYVVISRAAYHLMTCYFDSKDAESFVNDLNKLFAVPKIKAETYFSEFTNFLNDITTKERTSKVPDTPTSIPSPNLSYYYSFGDSHIGINYASNRLLELIHPYLQHASVEVDTDVHTVFDIFSDNGLLYLFKNKKLIGSYEAANFHFLQGKFAMELVTSIYKNTESDWLATFHASTICNEQEAIMIIGDSGNGKSTLSALLMAHGFDLLADDFTPMLAQNQHLYRFPAAISIKKGAFPMVANLFDGFDKVETQISSSKHTTVKYLPASSPFKSSKKHFKCHKLVMVKYSAEIASELQECSPEKILQTFIPDSWISPQANHSKQFLNWLNDLKFYELTYSDNAFAVTKFKELFEIS